MIIFKYLQNCVADPGPVCAGQRSPAPDARLLRGRAAPPPRGGLSGAFFFKY